MSITITCPNCGVEGKAADSAAGKIVSCPKCKTNWKLPQLPFQDDGISEDAPTDDLPMPGRRRRRPNDDREAEQRGRQYRCPRCRSSLPPMMKKKISPAGWVIFACVLAMSLGMCFVGICIWPLLIGAFICVPLSVLGLLITTEDRVCGECGAKLGR